MEQQDDSKVAQIVDNGEHFTSTFMDVIKDLIERVARLERANPSGCYFPMEIDWDNYER